MYSHLSLPIWGILFLLSISSWVLPQSWWPYRPASLGSLGKVRLSGWKNLSSTKKTFTLHAWDLVVGAGIEFSWVHVSLSNQRDPMVSSSSKIHEKGNFFSPRIESYCICIVLLNSIIPYLYAWVLSYTLTVLICSAFSCPISYHF
jgi:hypothetical protein